MTGASSMPEGVIRTLTAGRYDFLLFNEGKSGTLIRYKVTATQLEFYMDNGPEALAFIQKSFPRAVHVKKNVGEGEYPRITLLDDEALSILSKIPDRDPYWVLAMKSERIP